MNNGTDTVRARQRASTPVERTQPSSAGQTRPPSAHIDDETVARIPPELRDAARWFPWQWAWDKDSGRWRKPPIDPRKPRGKQRIDPHDPKNWMDFEAARKLAHGGGDGIGIDPDPEGHDQLVPLDFDDCLNDAGRIIKPDVARWVRALNSYAEITPSGMGLRVWVRGIVPGKRRRKDQAGVEIYPAGQYVTVTGRHFPGTPTEIRDAQTALDALYYELWPESKPRTAAKPNGKASGWRPTEPAGPSVRDDEEVIRTAMHSKNFPALWDGSWEGAFKSQSNADLALVNRLVFYCGPGQVDQVKRLFRRSGLGQRDKADRPDYLDGTVDRAYRGRVHYFDWGRSRSGNGVPPSDGNGSVGPSVITDGRQRPRFANAIPDKQGGEVKHIPILMPELIEALKAVGKGWPKRVDETLFVPSADFRPIYLESSTQFFAWLDGEASVYWAKGAGMIGQERLYEHVRKFVADRFEAIESYPHEPQMSGNFYLHPPVRPRRKCDLTERFLDFFHPASDVDRELIRAAILTPFWGGTPGARPAFRLDGPEDDPPELGGRGVGKTKSVELIAAPCGGLVDLRVGETISELITRLLSEEGRSKRILRIDNVKALRLSWADLEALITSKELSGKRLYRGEGHRPNVLTTFITVNGGSLSKDMATRQIDIRLARTDPKGDWLREAFGFVEEHRWDLIEEFLGALSDEPGEITPTSRWAEWETEVLSRVSHWDRCQETIAKRAKELDADEEDARECEEFFASKLLEQQHNPTVQTIKIPIPVIAQWLSEYEGKPVKAGIATRFLRLKPLKRLRYDREEDSRFWLWIGTEAKPTDERVELGRPPGSAPF